MADAQGLGDFFKSKSKKKIKASNLNKDTTTAKPEEKKANKKTAEDDAWEEEEIKASTIKGVESAGTLKKEEETKDDGDSAAPAWGALKAQKDSNSLSDKKYPTLAKAVGSTSIALEMEEKINIGTSKNVFAALKGQEDSDEEEGAPKSIKPAMVSKKKGEREKEAVARAVKDAKDLKKAKDSKKDDDDDEEDEEEDEVEEDEAEEMKQEPKDEARKGKEKKDKAKIDKEAKKTDKSGDVAEEDEEEDVKLEADIAASKAKYAGRRKLPLKEVPREELEEEKVNRSGAREAQAVGKKKKFVVQEEEKKLAFVPDDW